MKQIKIASILPNNNTAERIQELLRFDASKHNMQFVYDEENPDFLLVTNLIYDRKKLFKKFRKYLKKDCILIYFSGECATPDMNVFDYAIAFDRHLQHGDRIARLSTCRFYSVSLFPEYMNMEIDNELLSKKEKFCNFMYSHPYSRRDELFHKICEYKKVDSTGKHLNNTGAKNTRYDVDWRRLSIEDRIPYKFSIAAENASFPGYVSEKLLSCLEAHTIPIYWGDPTIGEELNTKAFINCHEYNSFDEVLDIVKRIDKDDSLFESILKEPWQTEEQKKKTEMLDKEYDEWILKIFTQTKQEARRRPIGTYPDMYRRWYTERYKKTLTGYIKYIGVKLLYYFKIRNV